MATTRTQYVEAIKSALLSVAIKGTMEIAIKKLPFLALRVVNPIFGFILEQILTWSIKEGEIGAFCIYIDLRTDTQAADFQNAALKYYIAETGGNIEELKKLEAPLLDTFRKLVSFTN